MRKLGVLLKKYFDDVIAIACSIVLFTSIACAGFGEIKSGRFDFLDHKTDFIEGKSTISNCYDGEQPVKHWTIVFDDGCIVKFITNLDDSKSRCWRWDHRIVHGKKA